MTKPKTGDDERRSGREKLTMKKKKGKENTRVKEW